MSTFKKYTYKRKIYVLFRIFDFKTYWTNTHYLFLLFRLRIVCSYSFDFFLIKLLLCKTVPLVRVEIIHTKRKIYVSLKSTTFTINTLLYDQHKKNISMNFLLFNDDSRNSNFITTIREQQNRGKTKVNKSSLLCDLRALKPTNFFFIKKDTCFCYLEPQIFDKVHWRIT